MKKLFTIAILVGAALLSTRWSHTPNENRKTDVVHSERVLELAKTEDGRLDLSILLASSRLPDERKKAFLDADEDKDGFLTQGEFSLSIPRSQAVRDGDGKKESTFATNSETSSRNHELDLAIHDIEVWFNSEHPISLHPSFHKNEHNRMPKPSRYHKRPEPKPRTPQHV